MDLQFPYAVVGFPLRLPAAVHRAGTESEREVSAGRDPLRTIRCQEDEAIVNPLSASLHAGLRPENSFEPLGRETRRTVVGSIRRDAARAVEKRNRLLLVSADHFYLADRHRTARQIVVESPLRRTHTALDMDRRRFRAFDLQPVGRGGMAQPERGGKVRFLLRARHRLLHLPGADRPHAEPALSVEHARLGRNFRGGGSDGIREPQPAVRTTRRRVRHPLCVVSGTRLPAERVAFSLAARRVDLRHLSLLVVSAIGSAGVALRLGRTLPLARCPSEHSGRNRRTVVPVARPAMDQTVAAGTNFRHRMRPITDSNHPKTDGTTFIHFDTSIITYLVDTG